MTTDLDFHLQILETVSEMVLLHLEVHHQEVLLGFLILLFLAIRVSEMVQVGVAVVANLLVVLTLQVLLVVVVDFPLGQSLRVLIHSGLLGHPVQNHRVLIHQVYWDLDLHLAVADRYSKGPGLTSWQYLVVAQVEGSKH